MVVPTQLASATRRIPKAPFGLFIRFPPLSRQSWLTSITAPRCQLYIRSAGTQRVLERGIGGRKIPRSFADRGPGGLEPLVGSTGCAVDPSGDRAGLRLERV